MSIERCCKHDLSYDTDFIEECPACEREDFEANVTAAEAAISKAMEASHDQG